MTTPLTSRRSSAQSADETVVAGVLSNQASSTHLPLGKAGHPMVPESKETFAEKTLQGMKPAEVASKIKEEAQNGASPYPGSGTQEDPYIVDWLHGEKENPYNWSKAFKWTFTLTAALTTLCIAFASSCYSGAAAFIGAKFGASTEVVVLGISLYVLGFGLGPLLWAPYSEMKGRREPFLVSYLIFALFNLGGALAQNIETIIITRFFAGAFGSSMLTNAGGMIGDVWSAKERGLATALFALAPFLGPVIGPIVGGFAGESYLGWRSVFYIMLIFALVMYIAGFFLFPETYAPVLIRRKAAKLQAESTANGGELKHYVGKYDLSRKSSKEIILINLTRPFKLLFLEPIILLLSIYVAIIYATLYMFFSAFPIVFQTPAPKGYGFSAGTGGLAFIGLGVGMVIGTCMTPISNSIYMKAAAASPTGRAPPEARLPLACFGACCLPVGLFWFAWTAQPQIHWIVPIIGSVPFGLGMILVFTSIIGYIIDSYLMFAASALAANAVLRSILGAVFPLFATQMYHNLGNEWASTLVAFLALACAPMPFFFYFYGARIRQRSRYAPSTPVAAPAAPAEKEVTSTATSATAAPQHEARPVIKERQPSANSALEPEWGSDAGEEAGERVVREAPVEMQRVREEKVTGHDAV